MSQAEGLYQFKIEYNPYDQVYLVTCWDNKGNRFMTSGYTVEEAFDMMSGAFLTVHEIPISWWNKLLHKLKRYDY